MAADIRFNLLPAAGVGLGLALILVCPSCGSALRGAQQGTSETSGAQSNAVPAPMLLQRESQRIEVLKKITPGVVAVMAPDGQGGGSGVLISSDGYAVSNFHVTSGSGTFMKCGLSNGQLYDAVIVGIDPTGDIALIKMTGRDDFEFATPGDSDQVRVGDEVLALGNPFLLASDFTPTVTYGIVSGVHRYQYPAASFLEYTDCIQIDASINPGNSGGPLYDIRGRWIGINGRASFEKRGRVNSGAAYAISVRQVQLFLEHLKCGLIVDHGVADFTVETLPDGRVVVSQISEVSEAWRRGLRPQDEILSFAGRLLTSANDFQNILGIFPEATRVPVKWRNRSGQQECTIRLRPLHAFEKVPQLPGEEKPDDPESPDAEPPATAVVPDELQALYEARDGFTNYYFNKTRQDALLEPLFSAMGPGSQNSATWVLTGTTDDQRPIELVVGQAGAGLTIRAPGSDAGTASKAGEQSWYQPAGNVEAANEPASFYGVLAGALQWQRFWNQRRSAFDDVVAMGRTVHLPTGVSVDVLMTRKGTQTSRWYFGPDSQLPMGVDVTLTEGVDEARLVFADWNIRSDVATPGRLGLVDSATEQIHWLVLAEFSARQSGGASP